jgi:integrase
MLYKDLEQDYIIRDWLSSTSQSPGTHRLYVFAMQYYTEFLRMTPEELLTEAEQDIQNGVLPRNRKIKRHLLDFKDYLKKQGLAPLTIKSRMTGVYSFYKNNDIDLPSMPRNETKARPLLQHKEIPTKEDIQLVLKHCDELERALILIGVSSGLAAAEICNLTIGDFRKGYDTVTGVTTLRLRREKVGYDFITFLSPEASNAVLDYLASRERKTKTDNQKRSTYLEKQKVYSESNYLLIRRKVLDKYLETKNERLRKLTGEAIIEIYRRLAEQAHKTTPLKVWSLIRSHNIRKYFNSALLNAGADSFIVNFFMGHIQDDVKSAYFRASAENGLRDTYLKYVPYLTIQKEADISESPEYLRIKQENVILQAETARHIIERSELHDLKEQLELERADRVEYERNVGSMVDVLLAEKMKQVEEGFNTALERIAKNMKEKPVDIVKSIED